MMPKPLFSDEAPRPLKFGTSGLRAPVADMTDLEVYINTRGYLAYAAAAGDVKAGDTVAIGGDLRPSTERLLKAVARAIADAGLAVEHLGRLPTPALAYYAMQKGRASVMVTGSHIPFHMNGIKYNRRAGEVLKSDEAGILAAVARVRETEHAKDRGETLFDARGMFKPAEERTLPAASPEALDAYVRRYLEVFPPDALKGIRILYYQHSSVGRDRLPGIFAQLGASVDCAGLSDRFIAIDTEDVSDDQLTALRELAAEEGGKRGVRYDVLLSTDGDSDRPMVVAIDGGEARFCNGDLLGAVVAEFLGAQIAAVPVSANSAVEMHLGRLGVELIKTRIGSPYVIQAMLDARRSAPDKTIVSWEANGGFLTGADLTVGGKVLKALPTRDAVLPMIVCLLAARRKRLTVGQLFAGLPQRFGKAGLIDQFPQEASAAILARFTPAGPADREAIFRELERFFTAEQGFGRVAEINVVDGLRIFFANGDVAHVRPSGNAPQLRIYADAASPERAAEIVRLTLAEPDGILRSLAK